MEAVTVRLEYKDYKAFEDLLKHPKDIEETVTDKDGYFKQFIIPLPSGTTLSIAGTWKEGKPRK